MKKTGRTRRPAIGTDAVISGVLGPQFTQPSGQPNTELIRASIAAAARAPRNALLQECDRIAN